jgi:hypothetical protein
MLAGNGKVVGLALSGQKYRGNEEDLKPSYSLNGKLETV